MKHFKWCGGRQGTGYRKMLLANGKRWDLYLLHYPKGSSIPWHVDPVPDGLAHHRCNLVLWRAKLGGEFYRWHTMKNGLVERTPRIVRFRPDIENHCVSAIMAGNRWVLSLGWLKRL